MDRRHCQDHTHLVSTIQVRAENVKQAKRDRRMVELAQAAPMLGFMIGTYICLFLFEPGFAEWIRSWFRP